MSLFFFWLSFGDLHHGYNNKHLVVVMKQTMVMLIKNPNHDCWSETGNKQLSLSTRPPPASSSLQQTLSPYNIWRPPLHLSRLLQPITLLLQNMFFFSLVETTDIFFLSVMSVVFDSTCVPYIFMQTDAFIVFVANKSMTGDLNWHLLWLLQFFGLQEYFRNAGEKSPNSSKCLKVRNGDTQEAPSGVGCL